MSMNPQTQVSLRRANPADWPAIAALLELNKLPLVGARDHLSHCVVAIANGEIVGTAGADRRRPSHTLEKRGPTALDRDDLYHPARGDSAGDRLE